MENLGNFGNLESLQRLQHLLRIAFILLTLASAAFAQTDSPDASPTQDEPSPEFSGESPLPSVTYHVTTYGIAEQSPAVPVTTRFGGQFNTVTEEQITRQDALDFYDALRNVPGVIYQKKNILGGQTSHSLYIRGRGASHPSPDLNVTFDDVPRSGVLYGQALADGIPVYALGGMEIYKSPQPSRFGSGYGMINFIPKHQTTEGFDARAKIEGGSYGTVAENFSLGYKRGKFDIFAAQTLLSTGGHVEHSAGRQAGYYANLGFQAARHWNIRFMGNYVQARTEVPNNPLTGARSTDRYDTKTGLMTLTLANKYDGASGWLKAYYNNTKFDILGESNGVARSRQTNKLYGLRGRETFSMWEKGEIAAGFDLDKTDLENYNVNLVNPEGPNNPRTWAFPDQTVFSPYAAVNYFVGGTDSLHFISSAGIRFYHHTVFGDTVAPQAGVVFGYRHTDLNFSYARAVNYPSPVVLQGFLANQSLPDDFDTDKIKPETANHYEVGVTHTLPGSFTLGGTYFYDRGKNRTRAYMYGGAPDELFFNSTAAKYRIQGFELTGRATPTDTLEFFGGATWLGARATGDDGVEADNLPYTPGFTFQAGANWNFLPKFTFSGDYQHFQGMYAGTAARTAPTNNPASNFPTLTELNRLPDADVVNLRVDYEFSCSPVHLEKAKIFVAVDNVFNSKYAYAMETGSAGEKGYYYMPGATFMVGMDFGF